jgi:hypothetical protein
MRNKNLSGSRRYAALLAVLLLSTLAPVRAESVPVLVCYPGGPVSENDARASMDAMLRVIERLGQWPAQQFASFFSSSLSECKQLFDDKRPGFSILSLGLYLERREKYDLVPLARPQIKGENSERFRVMAQAGKFDNINALKGKSLGGTPLDDTEFVSRVVFAGRYPVSSFFDPKPTRMALKSIRSVTKGELDAVLLNQQQYDALPALKLDSPLAVVFESDAIPLIGVVADRTRTQPQERERFAKAMAGLCSDAEGAKLCTLFGVDAFTGVEPSVYSEVIRRWNPNSKVARQ